uniref:F-box domain-containing protein n=1 Tax=Pithovirus LCPAC304 TaxID=2506594 RepID=A0A481Z9A8_9VIRU|nr:MAG: hypothetical protein LCPAC304_00460 [Pithovirus LCPAC304]
MDILKFLDEKTIPVTLKEDPLEDEEEQPLEDKEEQPSELETKDSLEKEEDQGTKDSLKEDIVSSPSPNEKVILDVLRLLDVKETAVMSLICKKLYVLTHKKELQKVILVDDGFKYLPSPDCVLKVTNGGCFVEIRLGSLEFVFTKPIRCEHVTIYSEVWLTEARNDVDLRTEYLWKFPDLPWQSLRNASDERLVQLLKNSEHHIGKSYPWFVTQKPNTLTAMKELHAKVEELLQSD